MEYRWRQRVQLGRYGRQQTMGDAWGDLDVVEIDRYFSELVRTVDAEHPTATRDEER